MLTVANETSIDLERSAWRQVVVGRPSHVAGRWVERPPPTFSTALAFIFLCRHVCMNPRAEPPQTLAARPRSWAGQHALGPVWPGVWPTWSMRQIHPRGDDDFDIWSISLCHPLKCSNLVRKFLKSNKH
jgi:hypothetical protein